VPELKRYDIIPLDGTNLVEERPSDEGMYVRFTDYNELYQRNVQLMADLKPKLDKYHAMVHDMQEIVSELYKYRTEVRLAERHRGHSDRVLWNDSKKTRSKLFRRLEAFIKKDFDNDGKS
jgi:hypothetical protein